MRTSNVVKRAISITHIFVLVVVQSLGWTILVANALFIDVVGLPLRAAAFAHETVVFMVQVFTVRNALVLPFLVVMRASFFATPVTKVTTGNVERLVRRRAACVADVIICFVKSSLWTTANADFGVL